MEEKEENFSPHAKHFRRFVVSMLDQSNKRILI
jgi:hypothetical protein